MTLKDFHSVEVYTDTVLLLFVWFCFVFPMRFPGGNEWRNGITRFPHDEIWSDPVARSSRKLCSRGQEKPQSSFLYLCLDSKGGFRSHTTLYLLCKAKLFCELSETLICPWQYLRFCSKSAAWQWSQDVSSVTWKLPSVRCHLKGVPSNKSIVISSTWL